MKSVEPRLMSLREAAQYSGLSYGTLFAATKRIENRLPTKRVVGIKRVLIERRDLDDWLDLNLEEA